MITCKELHEFMMRYVDGQLSDAERTEFESHMGICPSCVDYLDSYRTCIELGKNYRDCCDAETPPEMPDELTQAILKAKRAADAAGDA